MLFATILLLFHVLGFLSSVNALLTTRTAQGAIAWIVALNSFPILAVPVYWILGRNKFNGYVTARHAQEEGHDSEIEQIRSKLEPFSTKFNGPGGAGVGEKLAQLPVVNSNEVELLIDGEQTFDSIFDGIAFAREYILVQFYIVHNDGLGKRLKQALIDKAVQGVKVFFLYDEIGSHALPADYLNELQNAGAKIHSFHSTRGPKNRFQLNFRNHRKIVVVDGETGWIGGHNVGDEYLGKNPKFGAWRDTHMKIIGPAVLQLQIAFIEDFHWATNELLDFSWEPKPSLKGNASVLILPSGPSDDLETASLMYQQAIHTAQKRIWIASPYFVPDESVLSALHLAALRGVEVKILIPDKADKKLVYYSAYAFVEELLVAGIQIYRYLPGFLHEKVFLVDDLVAGVGTANFDNRSFRLNFEITALVIDAVFITEVEQMFLHDFKQSKQMNIEGVRSKSLWFRILSRASYLSAPVQ
jgi:cardiolipin synthase